jgi:hypothetical protein
MGSKDPAGISGRTSCVYAGNHIPATNEVVGVVE